MPPSRRMSLLSPIELGLLLVTLLALTQCCFAQQQYLLPQFTSTNVSRLRALATLGRITNSSLLVEAGDMRFLEEPATISENQKSFDELAQVILAGPEHYVVEHRRNLNIIYPVSPGKPRNRILTLQLGRFTFNGSSVSSLSPNLGFQISQVTGCHLNGFAYGGPPMDIGIPHFDLGSATFEEVVEQAARAPIPTMWIVLPDNGETGCIANPNSLWQVGIYGDPKFPFAFRKAIGPQLLR